MKRRKGRFSKALVALIVGMNIAFTAAVLVVFWHTGTEPVALIGAWFAFTTGELWMVATIRKAKIKKEDPHEDRMGKETE